MGRHCRVKIEIVDYGVSHSPEWPRVTRHDEMGSLYEPVRVRFLAGMIDPRPDQPKGGNVEGKSGLFAAKEPTSWIFEEVSLF